VCTLLDSLFCTFGSGFDICHGYSRINSKK
jgi:hypothetical protein